MEQLLASPVRQSVVEELASLTGDARVEGLSAAELGERLSLHTTTIRFHVDQLAAAGVLDAHFVRSGGVGRPSKKYAVRARVLGEVSPESAHEAPYAVLAGLLASALSTVESDRLSPEEAGVLWAQRRAAEHPPRPATGQGDKVEAVVSLLDEWGYTPQREVVEEGSVDIVLHECPFLDLAQLHPDVVCGVHRGLLRGALDAVGEPEARVSLRPFVEPRTCRARLYLTERHAQPDPSGTIPDQHDVPDQLDQRSAPQ